ncbi:MAG: exo-alpha-sialidase [Burkholderiales bacterium]|nr:exo-alpha-sialidase [Burkholderiales bacterium]
MIARLASLALLLLAASFPALAQTFSGRMSGSWWDASRAGEGQFIAFESVGARHVAWLAYFTYTADGIATWRVGSADYAPGATSIAIPLVTGSGPRFGAPYRATDLATTPAGTATLEFVACDRLRLRHDAMPGVTLQLTRLVGPLTGLACTDEAPPAKLVSGPSPFSATCGAGTGTAFINAEVEPSLAVSPADPAHLVAMWQQDRWSNGSARGLVSAVSRDGGLTWSTRPMAFSRCGGGTPANGGDFDRATDPWVSIGPDGTVWAMSLSTTGGSFTAGSVNAMLVSRSTDGGLAWGAAVPVITDTTPFFNDKNAITADPHDARYAYAVWDRLQSGAGGPATLARTTDGGASWEPARAIFDPGATSQTIGNVIVVPSPGTLVNVALRLDGISGPGPRTGSVIAIRSEDRGATWSAPVRIADHLAVGARDPDTGAGIRDGAIIPAAAAGPGGTVHVAWQDSRFSAGAHDAILYSRSADGGRTWSAPVRVNGEPTVAAFTPAVHVLAGGTVGITYYDLRDNTPDLATLPTGYWLARSADGVAWAESRLAGPFDLATAPNANGLFLGDYMGLAGAGGEFLSLYVRTTGDAANRNDVFFARAGAGAGAQQAKAAPVAPAYTVDAAWAARVDAAIGRVLAARGRTPPP